MEDLICEFFVLQLLFSPTILLLKLPVIKGFMCKQDHFPVTAHFSSPVSMCGDRWNPVADIIIITTIAYYKLNNKLWQIPALCLTVLLQQGGFTAWIWINDTKRRKKGISEGSKDSDEQTQNILFMEVEAHSINFNVLL